MREPATILDDHYDFSRKLEQLLREHDHVEAASTARAMIDLAESASAEMHRHDFYRESFGMPSHRGYDYLTDKGYLVGVCDSDEAIRLCEKAAKEGWFGLWDERAENINAHEEELAKVKSIIRAAPEIVQAELLKQYPDVDSQTLYYADKRGDIVRAKKGRSYALRLPE